MTAERRAELWNVARGIGGYQYLAEVLTELDRLAPLWEVCVLGNHKDGEISILKSSNSFGKSNWGQAGEDKILIVGAGHHDPYTEQYWDRLLTVAELVRDEMNREGG